MFTFLITIKTANAERDLYWSAPTVQDAIEHVKAILTGTERRWATVFAA